MEHEHRTSVQHISPLKPFSHPRSKSLPNITLSYKSTKNLQIHKHLSASASVASCSSPKKHQRPKILKKTWDKVKTIIHPSSSSSSRRGSLRKSDNLSFRRVYSSAPSTPVQKFVFEFENKIEEKESWPEDNEKIQRNYAQLQKRLSEELHQRMSEYKPETKNVADSLSPDFKKRYQQWEMWKVSTGKVTYTDEELQLILPEDFSKKLHEWECIKTGCHSSQANCESAASILTTASSTGTNTSSDTKNKSGRKKKNSDAARQKELAWLEKQLEKIETEKKRLERELKKYSEREARLEKMKEALKNSPSHVWITTPTANCKVDKITEKFTKKIYEWEERQGIEPESSTMALLCPQYYGPPPGTLEDDVSITLRSDDQIQCTNACGQTSSVSSSDYEEATDSFATHDKGNSGASNTDSDFYRAEPGGSRRRSSDAISTNISTPLSARSPSLSAFTSDDEGDPGLLKTVNEKEEQEENENLVKDAGSQTEVILRAKPIVVDDPEDVCDNAGVFVPTKRTIFSPIIDERETEMVIIEPQLKSPLLVKSLLQQQEMQHKEEQVWTKLQSVAKPDVLIQSEAKAAPPKIVGAIPKSSARTIFPKMGKIPVWCSPLGARRQFQHSKVQPEFSLDKFLLETNILGEESGASCSGVSRKYTIGGAYPPPLGVHRSKLLTRSNSFGIRLDDNDMSGREEEEEVPLTVTSDSDSSSYNVTKSKSTGSIKSFSRAFAHRLGFGSKNPPSKGFSGWLPKK